MKKTNFDQYLEKHLKDPLFKKRFKEESEMWDIALKLTQLREQEGLSQKVLAKKARTTQQQISRMESTSYQSHTISMLRRIAQVLHARVEIHFIPIKNRKNGVKNQQRRSAAISSV